MNTLSLRNRRHKNHVKTAMPAASTTVVSTTVTMMTAVVDSSSLSLRFSDASYGIAAAVVGWLNDVNASTVASRSLALLRSGMITSCIISSKSSEWTEVSVTLADTTTRIQN